MDFESFVRSVEEDVERNSTFKEWKVSENASMKFTPDGNFKEFLGDTVVIPLDEEDIRKVEVYQVDLYNRLGGYLAEKLPPETFHVTIHDLNNSLDTPENLEKRMEASGRICREIFEDLKALRGERIELVAAGITGGTTGAGVAFKPRDSRSFEILIKLHRAFDVIRHMENYVPHVTLGYYKPVKFSGSDLKEISGVLEDISKSVRGFGITLDVSNLSYQRFISMKDYETIFTLKDV